MVFKIIMATFLKSQEFFVIFSKVLEKNFRFIAKNSLSYLCKHSLMTLTFTPDDIRRSSVLEFGAMYLLQRLKLSDFIAYL